MRAAVAVVVLLSLAVAGCIGAGPASQSGEEQDWPTITDPTDLSYDTDSGFHVHDYWGGQTQLTVLNQTHAPTFHNCGDGSTSWAIRYHPEDGQVIPQGTESLTVTVTWEERDPLLHTSTYCNPALHGLENSYGDMELWVKAADASKLRLVEDDLTSGEPVQVPLEYEEADLPHQIVSAWDFEVRIRGSDNPGYNHFEGSITIEGDAHRGLELQPFPPHPDHWGDRTEFTLVDHSDRFLREYNPCPPTCSYSGYQLQYVRPPNGTIVPLGTDRVEVTLTYDNERPVGDLFLYYHAADTREFQRLEPDEAEDGEKRYVIPVNETMADTPYANASQWVFHVDAPRWFSDEEAPMYEGPYTIEATAYKE